MEEPKISGLENAKLTEDDKIIVINNDIAEAYDIQISFDCEELGKKYFVYSNNMLDSEGKETFYVSALDMYGDSGELENVTDPEELKMVEEAIQYAIESN